MSASPSPREGHHDNDRGPNDDGKRVCVELKNEVGLGADEKNSGRENHAAQSYAARCGQIGISPSVKFEGREDAEGGCDRKEIRP